MWIKRVLFWLFMSFGIVLRLFCIVGWDWFGLVLCSVCKKGKCLVFKGNAVKIFVKNSCSYFGYRLSYNYPNEVIPIVKKP